MTTPTAAVPVTRGSRAGLIALILGIVALVLAFVPFASYIAWAIGIAAVIVGIVALVKAAAARKGAAIAGIVLGAIAVIVSIVMSVVYTAVFFLASFASNLPTSFPTSVPTPSSLATQTPAAAGGSTVTYRVRGGGRAESISYLVADASGSGTDQVSKTKLPWTKEVAIKDPSALSTTVFSLTAQRGSSDGRITCEIEVDGRVISKHSSSGQYTVVSCSGTAG